MERTSEPWIGPTYRGRGGESPPLPLKWAVAENLRFSKRWASLSLCCLLILSSRTSHCCLSHVGISTILNTTTTSSDTDGATSTTFRSATRRLRPTPGTSRPKYGCFLHASNCLPLGGAFFGDSVYTILCPDHCVTILDSLRISYVDSVYCLKCECVSVCVCVCVCVRMYTRHFGSWLHSSLQMTVYHCTLSPCFTSFCFNAPCHFTLLNLRPFVFGLTPFRWLRSITLTPTTSIISYGNIILFICAHFFSNTNRA